MKRAELKVGESYVVLAPSQRAHVDAENYRRPTGTRVQILDTTPTWRSTSYGWRNDDRPTVKVKDFDGKTITVNDDTIEDKSTSRLYGIKPGMLVKVLEASPGYRQSDGYRNYVVTVVPLANIAMTWDEFIRRTRAAERRANEMYARRDAAKKAQEDRTAKAIRQRNKLNRELVDAGLTALTAKVVDSEVVLAGSAADLLRLVTR